MRHWDIELNTCSIPCHTFAQALFPALVGSRVVEHLQIHLTPAWRLGSWTMAMVQPVRIFLEVATEGQIYNLFLSQVCSPVIKNIIVTEAVVKVLNIGPTGLVIRVFSIHPPWDVPKETTADSATIQLHYH